MSEPIGKGDWVECVSTHGRDIGFRSPLVLHRVYRVRDTLDYPSLLHGLVPCLTLCEVEPPAPLGSFWAGLFRPVYRRRDAETLTAKLLEGARAKGPLVPAEVVREGSRETIKNTVEVEGE